MDFFSSALEKAQKAVDQSLGIDERLAEEAMQASATEGDVLSVIAGKEGAARLTQTTKLLAEQTSKTLAQTSHKMVEQVSQVTSRVKTGVPKPDDFFADFDFPEPVTQSGKSAAVSHDSPAVSAVQSTQDSGQGDVVHRMMENDRAEELSATPAQSGRGSTPRFVAVKTSWLDSAENSPAPGMDREEPPADRWAEDTDPGQQLAPLQLAHHQNSTAEETDPGHYDGAQVDAAADMAVDQSHGIDERFAEEAMKASATEVDGKDPGGVGSGEGVVCGEAEAACSREGGQAEELIRRNRELELEKKELADTVRQLKENNAQLLADGSKLMNDKFQSEELMRRNRELELEKKELADTVRQLEENNAQLLADGSKLMHDKFALETTIKGLRQTQAAREQEMAGLQQQITVLQQKNDGLGAERDALDVKLREVREDVAAEAKKAMEKKAKHVEQDASERIEMLTDSLETMQARSLSLFPPSLSLSLSVCLFLPLQNTHSPPPLTHSRKRGLRAASLTNFEAMQAALRRCEAQSSQKEARLRDELADAQRARQEAEERSQDLVTSVPEATRPLLKQIESLQAAAGERQNVWDQLEHQLRQRCAEVCLSVCLYVCMHTYMYVYIYVCMHVCIRVCMHACMHRLKQKHALPWHARPWLCQDLRTTSMLSPSSRCGLRPCKHRCQR